jgi:hypothetical protein
MPLARHKALAPAILLPWVVTLLRRGIMARSLLLKQNTVGPQSVPDSTLPFATGDSDQPVRPDPETHFLLVICSQ